MNKENLNNTNPIVTMTRSELDDLVYFASLRGAIRANEKLFNGLHPFLYQYLDELKMIINELDYIKIYIQNHSGEKKGD
ncbi:hypothetical protein [Schinkia azotoformans]|uniref:hypothetical protein n=1 Tax=Schinkia azotoformans TaxID=1454 RepID=UPI002DBFD1B4|nr:hypothetical protein [Schinkia azotoformans]MEC1772816.1 hypothetical protein [Schinkia azotoformans]MED4367465.1 hypothetical protein [Schinkia azotoformans]